MPNLVLLSKSAQFFCLAASLFFIDHAMNCPSGGYLTFRHNELRDFTANNALSEVCSSVCVELSLQTLSGEALKFSTAIAEDGALLDASANGFWGG